MTEEATENLRPAIDLVQVDIVAPSQISVKATVAFQREALLRLRSNVEASDRTVRRLIWCSTSDFGIVDNSK